MELYYQPHKSRIREAEFVKALIKKYNITQIHNEYYSTPANLAFRSLNTASILNWVVHSGLSSNKQSALILELNKLPSEILIGINSTKLTCDVVIIKDNKPYYIEFHEEQHRELTVPRPSNIYDLQGNVIKTPRFIQRLLRDLWRIMYLEPFTVIWYDWFNANASLDIDLFNQGYNEYYLPERFNFIMSRYLLA